MKLVFPSDKFMLILFIWILCADIVFCFSLSGIYSFVARNFLAFTCKFSKCCDDKWIISNLTGLESDLKSRVHGQHLVQQTVIAHIKGHIRNKDPAKALVLSFHGPTGVGKNFVSRIIAENLYKDGLHSPFVHLIAATKEFPHEAMVPFYKEKLKHWIEGNATLCDRSMFIFDEIDKMPSLLLDSIKPYLDHYQHLGGVNYRRTIFVFLSNTGSSLISNKMFEHWKSGKKRENMLLRDVEKDVMLSAINDKNQNGLWHSQVIVKNLVTAFIPFLPLERSHIRLCILDALISNGYYKDRQLVPKTVVDTIIEELIFIPDDEPVFSVTGCKRVAEKADFVQLTFSSSSKDEL